VSREYPPADFIAPLEYGWTENTYAVLKALDEFYADEPEDTEGPDAD
jgi:hypothetical protein